MKIEVNLGSEVYAQWKKQVEQDWHAAYDAIVEQKLSLFDRLIVKHMPEAYELLVKLVNDEHTPHIQTKHTEYAWMVIFAQIYQSECQAGETIHLYDYADSLQDLIAVMQQLKFYLWEIEFLQEEDSLEEFLTFAREYGLTQTLLRNLILIASVDRRGMAELINERLDMNIRI